MNETEKEKDSRWFRNQIKQYKRLFPRYRLYAETLQKALQEAAKKYAPLAIVQARPKSIASFAEKMLRKKAKYKDPVTQITDLCGARVITHTLSEIEPLCEFIEKHFDIDWNNTIDVSQRLKPSEFGYRSIHYIVKFKEGVFPTSEINVGIPKRICGLKAEIQVRTMLEHVWADFSHDMSYKGAFKIPAKWERELAGLAATLEAADNALSRIHAGLQAYASSYDTHMAKEQMRNEIDLLEVVLEHDSGNVEVAHRIGRLAIMLGDWLKTIDTLSKYVNSNYLPLLRDLGVALCKQHEKESPEYCQGQKYLKAASAPPNKDIDALCSLAGTWKEIDEDKVRELYRQAFEIDPSDPYTLDNYLECEIAYRQDASWLSLMIPVISAAIKRACDQADVGMNLPWAFYDLGKFYLLLGKPYESLTAYAKAIQLSVDDWMIGTSLRSTNKLAVVGDQLPEYEWVRRLMIAGLVAKFPTADDGKTAIEEVKRLTLTGYKPILSPVAIVVGGCDSNIEGQMQDYRNLVMEAFRGFKGTIISSGTTEGIGRFVGEVQQQSPDAIRTIGYVPRTTPSDVSIDKRYSEIRQTEGEGFSPMESLQYWIDLIASGIRPSEVKLLGINGGIIAAVEYRIALALGARVATVQDSGREAAKLLSDDDWNTSEMLVRLPNDAATVRAFIGAEIPELKPDIRETIARAVHETYRSVQMSRGQNKDPSLKEWDDLLDYLKESNRQQADHITKKLRQIGCAIRKAKGPGIGLISFTNDEIETMAEMEHARWNVERLLDGWKWGEKKDVTKKINPYIVAWSELHDDVKEWDRETVRKIPEFLAKVGLEVYRKTRKTNKCGS